MSDDRSELVTELRRRMSTIQTGTDDRWANEYRGPSHLERRALRNAGVEVRGTQMNLKVTARFKAAVERFAAAHKISSTEAMVRAFEEYAGKR